MANARNIQRFYLYFILFCGVLAHARDMECPKTTDLDLAEGGSVQHAATNESHNRVSIFCVIWRLA